MHFALDGRPLSDLDIARLKATETPRAETMRKLTEEEAAAQDREARRKSYEDEERERRRLLNRQRAEQARAEAALPKSDLCDLHHQGHVRARATGHSIDRIEVEVENLTSKPFHVVLALGTYFVARGSHQNMVVAIERVFVLRPSSSERFHIAAACIDASLEVPGRQDRFEGVARVPDDVARFLESAQSEDPMVIQAGVWAITDRYTAEQVRTRLVSFSNGRISWAVRTNTCRRRSLFWALSELRTVSEDKFDQRRTDRA